MMRCGPGRPVPARPFLEKALRISSTFEGAKEARRVLDEIMSAGTSPKKNG